MSYIWLSFCSGTSIVSSLAQHQIATQQARIYRTWLPSEIYSLSFSPILQNYHISERFQRATKRDKFSRAAAWEFDVVLNSRESENLGQEQTSILSQLNSSNLFILKKAHEFCDVCRNYVRLKLIGSTPG